MSLVLDPATGVRIHRTGPYREPADLLAHALDLVEAERADFTTCRTQLIARLEESFAQSDRGETYSPEEARAILATVGPHEGSRDVSPHPPGD